MIQNTKLRTKKTKFTDDEVLFMKDTRKNNNSLSVTTKLFEEKYNKTVTKQFISKMEK